MFSPKARRGARTRGKASLAAVLIGLICLLLLDSSNRLLAQEFGVPASFERSAFPEAILVPKRLDGQILINGGWSLIFRNAKRGPKAPDHEVQSRMVAVKGAGNNTAFQLISWEITRTQNNRCPSHDRLPCPDEIRVLALPEGFMAVPRRAWVEEGQTLHIHIVPDGIG